jgi:hypothetical protein
MEFPARITLGDSDQATVMAVAPQARCDQTELTKQSDWNGAIYPACKPALSPWLFNSRAISFCCATLISRRRRYIELFGHCSTSVCTENFIRVDEVKESPKLTE